MEKLDFSKQENRDSFEKLSKESKTAVINEVETEARAVNGQRTKTSSLVEKYDLSYYTQYVDISKQPEEFREYWKEYNRINTLLFAYVEKKKLVDSSGESDIFMKERKMMTEFSREIEAVYPDYKKYMAWHILRSSTPQPKEQPYFDFPDELSVERFLTVRLEKLEKEYPANRC